MATMRTADHWWTVEVVATRGGQVFKVREPFRVPGPGSWAPPTRICCTVDELRAVLGDEAFATLREV